MKGSEKFWSLMTIITIIFLNYLTWISDFIPRGDVSLTGLQLSVAVISCLVDLILIVILGILFFETLLPTFNKWLDEKF